MPTTIQLPADHYTENAGVFALLSSVWSREVEPATLKAMMDPRFLNAWKDSAGQLPNRVTPEWVEELSIDYCQLLIGPKDHVSPIQSVWDQGRFQGDAAESMQKYISMLKGFQPCVPIIDHVAVQLQFLSVLFEMAGQSKGTLIQGLATAFCRDHLEWTTTFFDRVEEKAQTAFYRSAAKISRRFLFG